MVLGRISHAKNRMEGPETFDTTWNPRDREIGRLYAGYQKALADASALDFDDLLLKTVELFDRHSAVRDRYARRFQFVMVDEYQDTNRPQYLLIKQLAGVHRNLCVVGDPALAVKRLAVSWGYCSAFPGIPVLNGDCDVLVIGEAQDWDLIAYAQDMVASGRKKGLVVLGHVLSEQWGMKYCAEWLRSEALWIRADHTYRSRARLRF